MPALRASVNTKVLIKHCDPFFSLLSEPSVPLPLSVTMSTGGIYLPPGCGALRKQKTASECRERRCFLELAAGSQSDCCELQVVRNRHRAAAEDVAGGGAAAAAAGGGGGWIPQLRCRVLRCYSRHRTAGNIQTENATESLGAPWPFGGSVMDGRERRRTRSGTAAESRW